MTGESLRRRLAELADLALEVLPEMFDSRHGLFAHKTIVRDGRYLNREPNVAYSTVALAGLLQQRRAAAEGLVPVGRALDSIHEGARGSSSAGLLAGVVWVSALAGDSRGADALAELAGMDPARLAGAEVGQGLFGLVTGAEAFEGGRQRAERAARAFAAELEARFSPPGEVFRGSPTSGVPRRSQLFAGITSFAGQVYPLHGLGALHRRTGEAPPAAAGRAAQRIVEAQGQLGQWWWIYSPRTKKVLEGYPVYSVHQDGMAFMGLIPMQELGAGSYLEPLSKGLDWLYGSNELSTSLVERDPSFIPRCIQRSRSDADFLYGMSREGFVRTVGRSLVPWAGGDATSAAQGQLEVLHECRSYHLGWLLYAHALVERLLSPS